MSCIFTVPRHELSCFSSLNSIETFYCLAKMNEIGRNAETVDNIMLVAKLFL